MRLTSIIFLILFFTGGITVVVAQHKFAIKIYQNTDFFSIRRGARFNPDTTASKVNFNRLSVAFDFHAANGLTHELELFVPEITRPIDRAAYPHNYQGSKGLSDHADFVDSFSLRYEVSKDLTPASGGFVVNLGLAFNPYFVRTSYEALSSDAYYAYRIDRGFSLSAIPRFKFKVTDHVSLDLNVPFRLLDIENAIYHVSNPTIPYPEQTTGKWNSFFFRSIYTVRLGVVYAW